MTEANILCGRKLEFGDARQIEALKGMNDLIDDFLEYENVECGEFKDIDDCEICICKCYAYHKIQETIKFYKTKGVWG